MSHQARAGRRYLNNLGAFVSGLFGGLFVSVPVVLTVKDRLADVVWVEGASMQPSLNPEGARASDVVLLNRWSVRNNNEVQRGDVVSVMSPDNKFVIVKRVIALEGDFVKTLGYKNRYVRVPDGHLWIEGDHHGHSLDSNTFGPVSKGLLRGRLSHIIWPPDRWRKIESSLPPNRGPLLNWSLDEEDLLRRRRTHP